MTYQATVLADTISESKKRVLSFELYYPRAFLHEEFLTHRVFSRNASSSRATPITAFIDQVKADPAMPIRWGKNGKGMQDHGEMTPAEAKMAERIWLAARDEALLKVGEMLKLEATPHKQVTNLLLRPWEHIKVVVTSTEWTNFFALRRAPDARPEFIELANLMWAAMKASTPKLLQHGEWHLPYIAKHELDALAATRADKREIALGNLIKVSAARCARTSYKNHRGKVATFAEDVALYEEVLVAKNHPSPLEHQCTPDTSKVSFDPTTKKLLRVWDNPELHGNLVGLIQHRKTLPGENITVYNPED